MKGGKEWWALERIAILNRMVREILTIKLTFGKSEIGEATS